MNPEGVPQLALVRVLSQGGPYRPEDVLSLAFNDPAVARIVAHRPDVAPSAPEYDDVPEAVTVTLLSSATPYDFGETLVLGFRNPSLARVVRIAAERPSEPLKIVASTSKVADSSLSFDVYDEEPQAVITAPGVVLLLRWSADDARRFIAIVDKLFTVDRLGWYRHALALRLLIADSILLNGASATEANHRLDSVRTIAADALNAPLLSAFMPQFSIDVAWLEAIEPPSLVKAIAALRKAIEGFPSEAPLAANDGNAMLSGTLLRREWDGAPPASVDAFLSLLIPCGTGDANVAQRLQDYRGALLELFSQMTQTSKTVRLKQMTSVNHVLDERLWNLAGALQDAYGIRVA